MSRRQPEFLSPLHNPKTCHLDRRRGSEAPEEEWRDPEDACAALLIQGILPECHSPEPPCWNVGQNLCGVGQASILSLALTHWREHVQLGWNASYRHGRG